MPTNFSFFGSLHAIGFLLAIVGLILLLAWAIKHMSGAEQKKWGTRLFVAGIAVCILSFAGTALSKRAKTPARGNTKLMMQQGQRPAVSSSAKSMMRTSAASSKSSVR